MQRRSTANRNSTPLRAWLAATPHQAAIEGKVRGSRKASAVLAEELTTDVTGKKPIGKGDFAAVYDLGNGKVLKVVDFKGKPELRASFEADMTKHKVYQGMELPVPVLYASTTTANEGRCLMEKLDYVYHTRYPCHLPDEEQAYRFRKGNGLPEGVVEAPRKLQEKVVRALEAFVAAGVAHNDFHSGNIGFDKEEDNVKIFDFGFSVTFDGGVAEAVKVQILAHHLYQLLEKDPKALMFDTLYYDVIYAIRRGLYSKLGAEFPVPEQAVEPAEPPRSTIQTRSARKKRE